MESEVTLLECRDSLLHDHHSSWKFKSSCFNSPSVKTAEISPIPTLDVSFYFELWYKQFDISVKKLHTFKIIFVKSRGASIPHSLKMNIGVSIIHNDGKSFRKCNQDNISVRNMDIVTIANEAFDHYFYDKNGSYSINPNAFQFDFKLNCHLVFKNHLSKPAEYYKDMRSLANLEQFANDFNCLYQQSPPPVPESANNLNNLEIKVGDETFWVHKSVLAAHSPVFLKMLNHDFLESKTNVINISDFSAETVEFFLEYLYSGEIEGFVSWPDVKELYALADKYDVRALKRECAEISSTFLSVEAVCEILKLAYDYGDDYLKLEGKKFAWKYIGQLLPRSDWKEMIQHNPLIGYEVMMKYAPKSD